MLRKNILIPIFILFILAISVFAVGLIEEDIGDYQYQEVPLPIGVAHQELTYANYQLEGTNKIFQVRIRSYEDSNSLNDYLNKKYYELMIKPKKYGTEIVYAEKNGENLFWVNGNNILFVGSERGNPHNFPEEIVKAYLDIYPKECNVDWCSEELCDKIFWSKAPYSGNVYWKHNGFKIWCKGRVIYGREGEVTKPDLTFEQFKQEINKLLFTEMYFEEEELKNMYENCVKEGFYKNEGLPLEGFLKSCYEKVYPKLGKEIEEDDKIDETSIDVCESVRLTIEENNHDDNLIDDLIDCKIEKELERREKMKEYCKNRGGYNEETAECNIYESAEDDEGGVIRLKPCTKEDLEEGRECIPVKKLEKKKLVQKKTIETEEKPKEYEEKQSESIFIKIISFFKRLFS